MIVKKNMSAKLEELFLTNFKEHVAHYKYNRFEKSSVAQHILDTGQKVVVDNLKLVKANNRELNSLESIFIHMNREKLIKTGVYT